MRTSSARRALTLVTALLLTPLLAGCAQTMATGATSAAMCDQFKPIGWSTQDTDLTIQGVKSHNAVHAALCRKR